MSGYDECALDLQVGLNAMGWPTGEMPEAEPVLARGGTVLLPCPACDMAGRPHTLEVRQADHRFIVFATRRGDRP